MEVGDQTVARTNRRNGPPTYGLLQRCNRSRTCRRCTSLGCSRWLLKRAVYAYEHAKLEWILLKTHWKVLLLGAVFQYVHKVATNVAYYMHVRLDPLQDLGFMVVPPLTKETQILSEVLFFTFALSTGVFALSPFFLRPTSTKHPPRYTIVMCARYLGCCVLAQTLRIICFLVTSLPGPNYHCRPGSTEYNPPSSVKEIFMRGDVFFGCGDLIFSSHTIFVTLCALSLCKYWPLEGWPRRLLALAVVFFGILVISARKHYSVDVFIALYTVPLVWLVYDTYFPDKIPLELTNAVIAANGTHGVSFEESEGLTDDLDGMETGDLELDSDLELSRVGREQWDSPLPPQPTTISPSARALIGNNQEEAISL